MLRKNKKLYIAYSLATTIIEELLIVAVLIWLFPYLGIKVPIWLIVLLVLGWAAWSYLTYRLGWRATSRSPEVGAEALIGTICQTVGPLCPQGYVRVGSELWKAHSTNGNIEAGVEVVITGIKELTLQVSLPASTTENRPQVLPL